MNHFICSCIREHRLLEFQYHGRRRVVAPYCHGVNKRGAEVLRAIQIEGSSASHGFGLGKLWLVADMSAVRSLDLPFVPDDPNYNPNDSAMSRIHCRI